MNRASLIAIRDWIGKSDGVINALDKSDTWAATTAATTDSRVRVGFSLDNVASQTIILTPSTSEEEWRLHREDGFLNVACFGKTMLDVLRIRDAVRRQVQDYSVSWPSISGGSGVFQWISWDGDGGVTWDEAIQLYRADGTIGIIVQNYT